MSEPKIQCSSFCHPNERCTISENGECDALPKTYTADEIEKERNYRLHEAIALGRNPDRAQAEADEWKAQFKPVKKP